MKNLTWNVQQSNGKTPARHYSELAALISEHCSCRGKLHVDADTHCVLQRTAHYQVGCDHGVFRVHDGFLPIVVERDTLGDTIVWRDVDGEDGVRIAISRTE
jgi:hypothetical protein